MYTRTHHQYDSSILGLHFHLYKSTENKNGQRLMLLHGSRLGGVETWDAVIKHLIGWEEILVPDLPGAGGLNPLNKTDHDFSIEHLIQTQIDLLSLLHWKHFDIAGYSFGGFISMELARLLGKQITQHFLLESALLHDEPEKLSMLTKNLNDIADLMDKKPSVGNQQFSALVSNNTRKFALNSNTRTIHNPLGFANLIKILTTAYCSPDTVWQLINAQHCVTSLLTLPASEGKLNALKRIQAIHPWKIVTIENADHGIIFHQPKLIAEELNAWYLARQSNKTS